MFRILDCEGKCDAIAIANPNHNCIHFLSEKSKKMIAIIKQIHPELKTIKQKLLIQEQQYSTQMKEKDTQISSLEKQMSLQDKKLTDLSTAINILNKESNLNKFKILKENAVMGDTISQIQLGKILETGNEYINKNEKQAIFWYERAKAENSMIAKECLKSLENENKTFGSKRSLVEIDMSEPGDIVYDSSSKRQKIDHGFVFGKSLLDNKSKPISASVITGETKTFTSSSTVTFTNKPIETITIN
jgi:uncharacterized protein (DUF3084 family)